MLRARFKYISLGLILTFSFIGCWTNPLWQSLEKGSSGKSNSGLLSLLEGSAAISAASNAANNSNNTINITNCSNNGTLNSGFLTGTFSGSVASVSISVNGSAAPSTPNSSLGSSPWKFQIPTGTSTTHWVRGKSYSVTVTGVDSSGNPISGATTTMNIFKGQNRDINGDGYADLVVGASAVTGTIYIYLSSDSTIQSSMSPSETIADTSAGTGFGAAMDTGDVNGDGYGDVIVGSPGSGNAYVFLGSQSGLQEKSVSAAKSLNSTGAPFGQALALGDLNADGFADASVGSVVNGYGQVNFYYGSSSGIAQSSIGYINSTKSGSNFGSNFSLGDANGDGCQDILIEDVNVTTRHALLFVAPTTCGSTTIPASRTPNIAFNAPNPSPNFPSAVALADVNQDGLSDVLIGDIGGGSLGRIYIYVTPANLTFSTPNQTIDAGSIGLPNTIGNWLTVGDMDANGYPDIIAGYLSGFYSFLNNSGTISTSSPANVDTGSPGPPSYLAADMNADGKSDMVLGSPNNLNAIVYTSSGTAFSPAATISNTQPAALAKNDSKPIQPFSFQDQFIGNSFFEFLDVE